MDYKYIEQLLERFWQCETTLEEEEILRAFFRQEQLPPSLQRYKAFFAYEQAQQQMALGEDFDAKILAQIEKPVVKAQRLTLVGRFMPLFKAVAVVAVMLALGAGAQQWFSNDSCLDYNYESYEDTCEDPQVAYEQLSSALQMVSEGIYKSQVQKHRIDSLEQVAGLKKMNIQE